VTAGSDALDQRPARFDLTRIVDWCRSSQWTSSASFGVGHLSPSKPPVISISELLTVGKM
jgi:hypothetical protein